MFLHEIQVSKCWCLTDPNVAVSTTSVFSKFRANFDNLPFVCLVKAYQKEKWHSEIWFLAMPVNIRLTKTVLI
jgi:hypothetical protein